MKFNVSSKELFAQLQAASRVIAAKNSLQILECVLFDLKGDQLTLTASDGETTLRTTMPVDGAQGEGKVAVAAKILLETLKEFSEQPLTFHIDDQNFGLNITSANGTYSFVGANGNEYPEMPVELGENSFEMGADVLLDAVNKTIFCTADDELRPVMNGVYFNFEEGKVTFVATDAHKLVRSMAECVDSDFNASFILPKKPANLLKGMLVKENAPVRVMFDAKNVIFQLSNHKLVCRLIEGNYPNYNAVIPTANPNRVLVDRVELVNGIKRVAVCSNPTTNLIRMDIAGNKISLAAQDIDFSVSANETISCNYDGQPVTIGFKSTFLVEILSNIDSPTVQIELADSTRAGVFKPVYDDKRANEVLMLLMPMMINA